MVMFDMKQVLLTELQKEDTENYMIYERNEIPMLFSELGIYLCVLQCQKLKVIGRSMFGKSSLPKYFEN